MKLFVFIIFIFFGSQSYAKQIRVAVIDSGISSKYMNHPKLCKSGHKSLVPNETIKDNSGHGTNVAGLIVKNAGSANYCLIIIKFYSRHYEYNLLSYIKAIRYAHSIKPDIINLSAGGAEPMSIEKFYIKSILNKGIKFIAAAGNEGKNLDKGCTYFPACYDKRIWVVSAKDFKAANQGKIVDVHINGREKSAFGQVRTGTSQSTAIFTGKVTKILSRNRK